MNRNHRLFGSRHFRFGWMVIAVLAVNLIAPPVSYAEESPAENLVSQIQPFLQILSGERSEFAFNANLSVKIDGKPQPVTASLKRFSDQAYDLSLTHPDYALTLHRRSDWTAMILPKHQVVFVGQGSVDSQDHLAAENVIKRLISSGTSVSTYASMISQADAETLTLLLRNIYIEKNSLKPNSWKIAGEVELSVTELERKTELSSPRYEISGDDFSLTCNLSDAGSYTDNQPSWSDLKVVEIPREELERTLARGVRRTLEVFAPSKLLTSPSEKPRSVPNGQLRWMEGQRVVLLSGSPEEIGTAHGQLLPNESQRCIDSVLYAFGTVQTIVNGRWFRQDLESAYARLSPHIPEDHKRETRAMAVSLNQDPALLEALNVFPEMFHCSGFAVFGSATVDGKMYHGRVLDYMTTIGLQDCCTTFIVSVDGKIPFANVGYAAFTGSVSGMNVAAISLGEMGGRGEGNWDGVPMATLMRRALEECDTLEEVQNLWSQSPRTCEYYYVFADGNQKKAVGVAATPDKIEFVLPGQGHELLGDGIPDAVVLSAGDRLTTLRQRVASKHGSIDATTAQWLMSRPVAMQSNLHNVLFVPEDGVLYVANADHKQPAAERPYVMLNLRELAAELPLKPTTASK